MTLNNKKNPAIILLAGFILLNSTQISFAQNITNLIDGKCADGFVKFRFSTAVKDESAGEIKPFDKCVKKNTPQYNQVFKNAEKVGDAYEASAASYNEAIEAIIPAKVTGKVHKYETQIKIPCQPSIGPCPSEQTPAGYVARIYTFALMIAGLAAFGGIIYGSLKYILSAGNIGSQQDAKDQITQAILGLILLLGSFLILYTINPDLVNLRNPNLEPLNLSVLQEPEDAGEQRKNQPGNGDATNDDPLCALSVNAGIILNTNLPGLTSGPQNTGYACVNCKDNAHREGGVAGVGGSCVCNNGYSNLLTKDTCEKIGLDIKLPTRPTPQPLSQ